MPFAALAGCGRRDTCRAHRLLPALIAAALAGSVVGARRGGAQELASLAPPEAFGLELPDAPARSGGDRRVVVGDAAGQAVVARVLAEVGDRLVVVLPDGRLASVPASEITPSDRPPTPADCEAIVAELTAGGLSDFTARVTKRYLYLSNASQEFCTAASRILETMYPKLVAWCQRENLPVHEPQAPLVVVVFRTEAEFQRYRPMPPGVVAYYSPVTNQVVMYEQSDVAQTAPELALRRSISTIAHEGVHQVLHNIGVQQRLSRWPLWLSEGLPEYFAPTEVDRRVRWKGVGLVNDLRMHGLLRHLDQRTDLGEGRLVREIVEAESLDAVGYAQAWALVHFLARTRRRQFSDLLHEAARLGPLEEPPQSNLELFARHFGDDLAKLEAALLEHVRELPYADPFANQTHFVARIRRGDAVRVLVTTSPAEIQAALAASPGAEVEISAYPSRDAAQQAAGAAGG